MSSKTLFRLSGLALLMALPIQIVGFLLHPPSEEVVDVLKSIYGPAHIIIFVSWVFALLGLPGLYARQAHRAGVLGLIGFVLTMLAAAYHFYLVLYEAYATPLLAKETATQALIGPGGPLAHGAGALGPLAFALILAFPLFGIATVRAGVLPRGSGWLQIVCVPVFFLGMILLPPEVQARLPGVATPIAMQYYLLFLGYAWGGYALWTEKERLPASMAQMEEPQPAAPEPPSTTTDVLDECQGEACCSTSAERPSPCSLLSHNENDLPRTVVMSELFQTLALWSKI